MQFRRTKKNVDGILLLDKPLGFSSNQALQKVKHLYQAAKAGHTGTLDPLATGLLPICLGEATKFAQYITDADKTYVATVQFGSTTTTGDAEGEVLATFPVLFNLDGLIKACAAFTGAIKQTPPMYSALKFEGKALYEYARAGIDIAREARRVTIYAISVNQFSDHIAQITVRCSKGTYIRTLAEDIAKYLECGAHLIGLRRIETAGYAITNAITLEALIGHGADLQPLLLPVDSAVADLPSLQLNQASAIKLMQGQTVFHQENALHGHFRIYDADNQFLGLGLADQNGKIVPKRLISHS